MKSFTEQIDNLPMWNRYANDYESEGNNSNGCCVIVEPECFIKNNKRKGTGGDVPFNDVSDDYNLYRIVYVSQNGSIDKSSNPGLNSNVIKLYENLKELIFKLNGYLERCNIDEQSLFEAYKTAIEDSLLNSLMNIVFLFKYDNYSDEHESRLLFFRTEKQQDDIKVIDGEIPLLALNPFFQILIKGLIFGPNVRNVEKWKPYFQYQLNRMWKKEKDNQYGNKKKEQCYTIEKSQIDYFT